MSLISVVLPVYNAAPYLGEAIQSILNQTLDDFELIIVDDASTDRSLDVAYSFSDHRIKVLSQEVNHGYPAAMSAGLRVAQGKYIARMDADDVSASERLARQVELLEHNRNYVFVATRRYWLTPNGKRIEPAPLKESLRIETWDDLMSGNRLFTDASVVVERRLVDLVGGYRTYQRSGQDVDLWLRLLELGRPLATLTEPLYGRRLLPSAITFSPDTTGKNQLPRRLAEERKQQGTDAIMRGEAIDLPIPATSLDESRRWRFAALWKTGATCIKAGDYPGGISFVRQALSCARPCKHDLYVSGKYGLEILKATARIGV